jgi:cell wall-associated NlpC family hydrolase
MTAPVTALETVLARIASIQSTISALANRTPGTSSTSASTFAQALDSVTSGASGRAANPQNPVGTVNGVTYSDSAHTVTGADVVATAKSYLGVPYVYAGNDRNGIDCSGLVQQTYRSLGMELPRVSWDQQKVGTEVASLADARLGDVLAFGEPSYHVAIYLGGSKMIEAPKPGEKVQISNVWATPSHIRRIVAAGSSATSIGSAAGGSGPSAIARYSALFHANQARYNLPAGLLSAVAQVESGGNASAVSPAGAQGLMQLMPATAASLGVDPSNPIQSVDGAARMLSGLLTKYKGSVPLALAAYNAGPAAVDRYHAIPPYAETQSYVVKVQKLMAAS